MYETKQRYIDKLEDIRMGCERVKDICYDLIWDVEQENFTDPDIFFEWLGHLSVYEINTTLDIINKKLSEAVELEVDMAAIMGEYNES